jgi:hypothetical protein
MKIVFCVILVTLNTVLVTANSYTYNARTCDPNEIITETITTYNEASPCQTGLIAGQMKMTTRSATPFLPQWSRHSYRETREYSNSYCFTESDDPTRTRLNDVTVLSILGPLITRCDGNISYSVDSDGNRYNEFPVGKCFASGSSYKFITCVFNNTATSLTTTSTASSSLPSISSSPISADDSSASTLFTHCWLSAVLALGTLQSLRP